MFPNDYPQHNGLEKEEREIEGGWAQPAGLLQRQPADRAGRTLRDCSFHQGFAEQIRATLEKAAAVARDNYSNSFLANELEESGGSQGRMAPLGPAERPLLP